MRRRPLFLLFCALSAPLAASDDWLALSVPQPLASRFELSLGVQQAQRETWAHQSGHPLLKDAEGQKLQRLIAGDMSLRWQWAPHQALAVRVPVVFSEIALWTGALSSPRVDDPAVDRSQGLGDISVEWRQDYGAWGWGLGAVAPTGLGPWEAPHPLASTGEGRWQGALRLSAGLRGESVAAYASATGRLHAGRESILSAAAPIFYDAAGARWLPAGASGAAYLDPRWGAEAAVGLAWDWHRGENDRHGLALSVCARHLGPLGVGGSAIDETASVLVWLQPELHARFGDFNALAGWQSPALIDDNLAVPQWGELHLRLDYAL